MESNETDFFIITEEEAGERLDKVLAHRFDTLYSRTYFQHLIEQEYVSVNGSPVKKRIKSTAGDEIKIRFASTPETGLAAEPIPLCVIYEDETLLVINKPAGMVIHPAPGHRKGTLVNALLYWCGTLPETGNPLRPGIVHRLDKDTSGIILAAKTTDMQQKLTRLFSTREIHKEYLAVCVGNPPEGEISAPIGRHPVHRKQMAIVPNGREAISTFRTLVRGEKLGIVHAVIATGRTHQIRVHLKHLGTPILGDSLYGNPSANLFYHAERQLLHASLIRFIHPLTGKTLEFTASLPPDMERFVNKISSKNLPYRDIFRRSKVSTEVMHLLDNWQTQIRRQN